MDTSLIFKPRHCFLGVPFTLMQKKAVIKALAPVPSCRVRLFIKIRTPGDLFRILLHFVGAGHDAPRFGDVRLSGITGYDTRDLELFLAVAVSFAAGITYTDVHCGSFRC